MFYAGMPLLGGSFTGNPNRIITLFDPQGNPLGPPVTLQNVYARVEDKGFQILPPGQDLDSTPYDVTWNAELDREIGSRVTLRLSYLASRTYNLFVAGPQQLPGSNPLAPDDQHRRLALPGIRIHSCDIVPASMPT